ncbi:MAG: hypothetical protein V1720_04045 [bacterium]
MKKKFDCVEMKHKAARIIQTKISKMSLEEELEYWKEQTKKMTALQKKMIKKRKVKA